jgi:hypothetical protein
MCGGIVEFDRIAGKALVCVLLTIVSTHAKCTSLDGHFARALPSLEHRHLHTIRVRASQDAEM